MRMHLCTCVCAAIKPPGKRYTTLKNTAAVPRLLSNLRSDQPEDHNVANK